MKVCYDKLWKLLIDKKLKRTDLIKNANISSNVLARMGHEEPVSLDSIGKICEFFLVLRCEENALRKKCWNLLHFERKCKP